MMTAVAEMLAKLIAFDTVSSRSNLGLIHFIRDLLAERGIVVRVLAAPDGQPKANLWATIGPDKPGGIVLSGHTDVVPVEGQPWSSDPFTLRDGGDRYFGRGTCDMKGFIALCLALLPEMQKAPLTTPIHFAFSYDEEMGCLGAPHMVEQIGKQLPAPRIAIIGEPTEMRLGTRHKGCYGFVTKVTGKDGHSSQTHRGVNAIAAATEIAAKLLQIGEDLRVSGPHDHSFDPPYCTLNLGSIHGGTAVNIIARECALEWDFRPVPGGTVEMAMAPLQQFIADDLLPRLKARATEADITTTEDCGVPPLIEEREGAAEALVKLLTGANNTYGMAFATEAGQFQQAGLSAIVCGPGSITQAHKPDEFILKSELVAGEAFLRKLIDWARVN
jgi:acetylornithine deacetylase